MLQTLLRGARRLVRLGVSPQMPRREAKHVMLANEIALFLLVSNAVVLLSPQVDEIAAGTRAMAVVQCIGLSAVLVLNARGAHRLASNFVLFVGGALATAMAVTQPAATNVRVYFIALAAAPWLVLPARYRVARVAWTFAALVVLAGVSRVAVHVSHASRVDAETLSSFALKNEVMCAITMAALAFYATRQTDRVEGELEQERARSDLLLYNVLPNGIAERLKAGSGAIAERFDGATVLFADIARFTTLAETMSPSDLVSLLDRVFTRFDALADLHRLEKIKTVGDAYMLAGGVPESRADHVEAVADVALAMRQALADMPEARAHALEMRIGMHTGPLVAGVIGKRKLVYDLWGDTVNVASRMESHGEPGKIQVSEAVYEKLAGRYAFEARAAIAVKGKGELRTWFLVAKRA